MSFRTPVLLALSSLRYLPLSLSPHPPLRSVVQVCIVKKKDTKQMYAMKYMNKVQIIHKHAVENVLRESEILRQLDNPFLVNLWFAFHDREDIFMVLDLMLGETLPPSVSLSLPFSFTAHLFFILISHFYCGWGVWVRVCRCVS